MAKFSQSRSRHDPELTIGDRLVTAFVGGICTFGTAGLFWVILLGRTGRRGQELEIPFHWVGIITGVGALASFAAGPERTMDVFQVTWKKLFGRRRWWN
ncbi:hypothetical protein ACYOEI_13815 [Singulisphaera rosea]